MNNDARGTYHANSQIKSKIMMLNSSLCDYSDAYIFVNRTITVFGKGETAKAIVIYRKNREVIFKNCVPFTDSIIKINMHNLIEFSDNYAKTSGSLRQSRKNDPNDDITDYELFKFESRFRNNS